MDNNELKEKFKFRVAISEIKEENNITHQKHNTFVLKKSILVASAFLILTTGIVFAENIRDICNNFVSQNFTSKKIKVSNSSNDTTYQNDESYRFYEDMKYEKGIYYKKVDNYKDYLFYKNMWNDLLDMKEEDFIQNFMIITAADNADGINQEITDIYTYDETLYIEFDEKETYYDSSVVIGTKLSRDFNRNNIKITQKLDLAITDPKYMRITDIPSDYSVEQAINDNCIVIDQNTVLENKTVELKEFVEKCNNGIECNLRIYTTNPNGRFVEDIQFINNKYKVNTLFLDNIKDIDNEEYLKYTRNLEKINNIKDIRSEEYTFLEEYNFVIGEKRYTDISVTNDNDKVYWTPLVIYIN